MNYLHSTPLLALYWSTLKSIISTLSLLPASYLFHYLWFYSNDSDQLFIRFFALTTFISWIIVTFTIALYHTQQELDDEQDNRSHLMQIYRQIPLLFFTAFILFLQAHYY